MQRQTYLNIDTIVIDEISMVRADLLDCVDAFMRTNGKDASLPFGGVQMIFVGDLYQLPPVVTKAEEGMFKGPYKSQYFFDSNSFGRLDIQFIELEKHHRQTEEYFIELLNAIRNNVITNEQLDVLNLRLNASFVPDATKMYITLTSTNRVADEINAKELARLETKEHIYTATLGGDFDKKVLPADEVLRVKEGMQVMMLNNDKAERWVNGSVGTVIGINSGMTDRDVIIVRLSNGSEVEVAPNTWNMFKFSYDQKVRKLLPKNAGSFIQYPIAPAWAVTIHKSQGKTFKDVIIDIGSGTFANGQLYVALSRCTTLRGIILKRQIERRHILTDPRIVEFFTRTKK
jgi:ATP-dependent exoDNAse (exonuclease V) alpha subunit